MDIDPLDEQLHDARLLGREQLVPQWIKPFQRLAHLGRRHRRNLVTYLRARAKELRQGEGKDLLVIGQKAAIDALRSETLPARVDSVHFHALSGIDRWGSIAAMVVLGRTLPAPVTVKTLAIALTGRAPRSEASASDWWYGSAQRRIRLAGRRSHAVQGEVHDDPVAEAIRWSICEGELIQAIGRGRGVNRSAADPLQIDLLTDVVLPVTVDELLDWQDLVPARRDIMASRGVVLDNAADMARCFPDLWESADAARQDRRRSVTNGYYRSLYNSEMSHSWAWWSTSPRERVRSRGARRSTLRWFPIPNRGSPSALARWRVSDRAVIQRSHGCGGGMGPGGISSIPAAEEVSAAPGPVRAADRGHATEPRATRPRALRR